MFFIYGWGQKSKSWKVSLENQEKALICTYKYFSLFFLPWVVHAKWQLMGQDRREDQTLPYAKVKELFPEKTPGLGIFRRFMLPIVFASLIGLVVLIGVLAPTSDTAEVRSNSQILQASRYTITDEEIDQMARTATEDEFADLLSKYNDYDKAWEMIMLRAEYKYFPSMKEKYALRGDQIQQDLQLTAYSLDDYFADTDNVLYEGQVDETKQIATLAKQVGQKTVYQVVEYETGEDGEDVILDYYTSDKRP